MHPPPPTPEHLWLHRLLGSWTWAQERVSGQPGEDHEHEDTIERWRTQGDAWVVGEGDSHGPMMFTLGYDTAKGRFVGSFITALATHFWTYDGHLDGPDKLVLFAVGPNMGPGGGMANFRDEIEFMGPDERVLRSYMEMADGTWEQFMQARSRRVMATPAG